MIISNRNSYRISELARTEDRAKWGAERELEQLRSFYSSLERLVSALEQFRIQQAWDADLFGDGMQAPVWVPNYNDARHEFEFALHATNIEVALLAEPIQTEYECVKAYYLKWLCAKTKAIGVNELAAMEEALGKFRNFVAKHQRNVFDERRRGMDLPLT